MQKFASSGRNYVWGTVSPEGLGPLFRTEGSLASDDYCTIINHVMLPYVMYDTFPNGDFVFQHDLSPVYMSRKVLALLEERSIATPVWPPKSADLNIIGHVWGRMKETMARRTLHRATSDEHRSAVNGYDFEASRNSWPRSMAPCLKG